MFAIKNIQLSILVALSLVMFVSASSHTKDEKYDGPRSFPMVMWQRTSNSAIKEVDDVLTASQSISNLQSFV